MNDRELIRKALEARERAYARYSGFAVGAALLTKGGKVYLGANVENASWGLSICAERVALFSAITAGEREFTKLAVVADAPEPVLPCGACRQVIQEFSPELTIICTNLRGETMAMGISELLPYPFFFGPSI